jgi:hypothetical protein
MSVISREKREDLRPDMTPRLSPSPSSTPEKALGDTIRDYIQINVSSRGWPQLSPTTVVPLMRHAFVD